MNDKFFDVIKTDMKDAIGNKKRRDDEFTYGYYYYLIYRDGSSVVADAEDIANGSSLPSLEEVAYASVTSEENAIYFDTEVGDVYAYLEKNFSWKGYANFSRGGNTAEDIYGWSVEIKYGAARGKEIAAEHPDFVPLGI